jgi:hypothetical protein
VAAAQREWADIEGDGRVIEEIARERRLDDLESQEGNLNHESTPTSGWSNHET